jgi:glycosyltransferase involved in cell wall biosynthesis
MDGYRIAGSPGHIACPKGVIADEVRFEHGLTRLTMSLQARCERLHARRAAGVVTCSRYSARCAQEFYSLERMPLVVPEPIDLSAWRAQLAAFPAQSERFTVLYVGRFYRRKRVNLLLDAAARLRAVIPNLEVRIVGNGPCAAAWHAQAHHLKLENTVTWLNDIPRSQLAAEYNRADLFCFPSVQEAFGIVLLEAMTAGKPIVAARAAAVPEVVPHASLVEPDNADALASAILDLYGSPEVRAAQRTRGLAWVEQFDAPRVAQLFVDAVRATLQI